MTATQNSPALPGSDLLADRTVSEYSSPEILSCAPDAPLGEVAWLMAEHRVHALVLADEEAAAAPVLSDTDLVGAVESGDFDQLSARDIAATEAVSVGIDDPLRRAAQLLSSHGVTHLIVRDHRRQPVGVISTQDIARAIAEAS
jgi:predicted transcriptional regulator